MTTRARLRAAVLATATLLLALGALAPASAVDRGEVAFKPGDDFTRSYPGPPASNPGLSATPSRCATLVNCDVIKLNVSGMEAYQDGKDDFFIRLTLTWRAPDRPTEAETDLDMYVYDDQAASSSSKAITRGASSAHPEYATIVRPGKNAYWITVNNWAGFNQGYTLRFEWVLGELPDLRGVEKLGPQHGGTSSSEEPESFEQPHDFSADRAEETEEFTFDEEPPPPDTSGDEVAAPPAPLAGDKDFDFDLGSAASNLQTGDTKSTPERGSTFFDAQQAAQVVPAGDVAPLVLILWLVVAPLGAAGLGGYLLYRRRPAALT